MNKEEQISFKTVTKEENIKFLVSLANKIWTEHFGPIFNDKEVLNTAIKANQSETAIRKQISEGTNYFFITRKGRVIGYFAYKLNPDHLFISKVYLISSEQRQGLGSMLLRHLEKIAKENHKNKLMLTVYYQNHSAINAYLKNGFQNIKTIERDFGSDRIYTDYIMEKSLA